MEYFGRKLPEVLQRTFSCLFLKRHRKLKLIRVRAETIRKYWIIKKVKPLKVCFKEYALKQNFVVFLSCCQRFVTTGQSECRVRSWTQGIQLYSKAFMQAIASNRRQPESWLKAKHKCLRVIYKSKKQVHKNPRALDLQRPGKTKTWSLWSTSSPLSRSILTISYRPLMAALCRRPLDAYFLKNNFHQSKYKCEGSLNPKRVHPLLKILLIIAKSISPNTKHRVIYYFILFHPVFWVYLSRRKCISVIITLLSVS